MALVEYILDNFPEIGIRTIEHIEIVGVAVGAAIVIGVPIGIACVFNRQLASVVLYLASVLITVPSVALFGLLLPVLSLIGHGIGFLPAVVAIFLYSLLPIVRNTYTGITSIDPAIRDAARGMGMTRPQSLVRVEVPLSLPIIVAGIRVAVVMNIGVAAIATYIGAGGLGRFIQLGISQTDERQIITGALAVSVLAIASDFSLNMLQKALMPRKSSTKGVA